MSKQAQTDQTGLQGNGTARPGSKTGGDKVQTVAGFFANPPDWLNIQLKVYRKNPEQHIKPLCSAVAAVVLGDGALGTEVREGVERELAKR